MEKVRQIEAWATQAEAEMFALHNQSRSKANHDKCLTARLAEAVRKLRVAKNQKEAQLAEMQRIIRAMREGRPVARPGATVGDDDGGDDTDEDSRSDAGGSEASPVIDLSLIHI